MKMTQTQLNSFQGNLSDRTNALVLEWSNFNLNFSMKKNTTYEPQ